MELIAIVSAAAACVAAWYASRSAKMARSTYRLALEQEERLKPSLEIYLVEAHIQRIKTIQTRICVFRILITNKSDAGNSIKHLDLVVEYKREGDNISKVAFEHNPEFIRYLAKTDVEALRVPAEVKARSVTGGLAIFQLPRDLFQDSRIEAYAIRATDIYGHETELEAILLKELGDEQMEKKRDPAYQ